MAIVRTKICGITRVEDALSAVAAGVDAIGLVFYARSPRAVSIEQARTIVAALPPFVTTVGLFVDAPADEIRAVLAQVPLDTLQFHGGESAADCAAHGRPWYKAVRVQPGDDLLAACHQYAGARALLLDAYVKGVPGGTGTCFDWSAVPAQLPLPIVLAGGLNADNVATAIEVVRPYAVDVSGGVEQARGIKCAERMQAFVARVRTCVI